ncbi:phosphoenolpyruvate--protein phosphotransferase [Catenulispora subtropica]|uniref:Phosphoenolpyruvate-protein phosphotransferase n=1 Tax=Catenulispora subtropica TaxID=450798 RepID=A0ABP5EHJ1_9ACTN
MGEVTARTLLSGLGVSAGAASGPVARMGRPPALPGARVVADAEAEAAAARSALAALTEDLEDRAARTSGAAREILEALAMIAADPLLAEAVAARVAGGADAPHAVTAAFDEQAGLLREGGGYLAERAADLEDLRDRAVAWLLGAPMPGLPAPGHPFVLVADDLAPADTAMLDPADVLAVVTVRGGPTSHTAILARALGIPAVVGVAGALELADGVVVAVDGDLGTVRAGGSAATASAGRPQTRVAVPATPGRTADGHPVELLLNIGSAKDVRPEAEGVGLFRTEFLFLGRRSAPSPAEQRAAYAEVLDLLPGRKVVIRTLDAGADKPLPFLGLPPEENPALGIRGLRTAAGLPQVLDDQLAAIAQAAAATTADVWVMAPMVATPAEAASFAARARHHGLAKVGVMIEIPAAALRAHRILRHVDFLSIGTNDLGQYTMAADRQDGRLSDLLDPWQPALLDLIGHCADAGRTVGRPVGVCGEAAADPRLAPVLVGLGISSLSMAATAVPAVHAALAERTLDQCARAAARVLDADDPSAAREAAP